jgi:hypothetical protein
MYILDFIQAAHVFLPHGIVDALARAASGLLIKHLHFNSFLHPVKFGRTLPQPPTSTLPFQLQLSLNMDRLITIYVMCHVTILTTYNCSIRFFKQSTKETTLVTGAIWIRRLEWRTAYHNFLYYR